MIKAFRSARHAAWCVVLAAMLAYAGSVWAGPCLQYPYHAGGVCIPNTKHFGHFTTTWRRWPGKPQLDVALPHAIGAERIPTPPGQPQQPLPPAETVPGPDGRFGEGMMMPDALPSADAFPTPGVLPTPGAFPTPEDTFVPESILPPAVPEVPGGPQQQPFPPEGLPQTPGGPPTPGLPGPPALPMDPGEPTPLEPTIEEPLLPLNSPGEIELPRVASQTAFEEPMPLEPKENTRQESAQPEPQPVDGEPELISPHEDTAEALLQPVPEPVARQPAPLQPQQISSEYVPRPVSQPAVSQPAVSQPAVSQPAVATPAPELVDPREGMEHEPPKHQARAAPLQANWMAALHPGFRGDAGRMVSPYPWQSPTRPAAHQAAVDSDPTPATRSGHRAEPGQQPAGHIDDGPQSDSPPVALDGFCPVELVSAEQWTPGDPRFTAVHGGRTYLLAGTAQRQRFLADPQRYTPRYSGHDPVVVVDGRRHVGGDTDYCVIYEGRLYMFSSSVTLERFRKHPERYVTAGGR